MREVDAMVDPEWMVNRLVKLGVDDAICEMDRVRQGQVRFANSRVVLTNTGVKTTFSIFLAKGGRLLGAEINDLTSIDDSLERLVKSVDAMQVNREYRGIAKGRFRYPETGRPLSGEHERLIDYSEECITSAENAGAVRTAGVVYQVENEREVHTSTGIHAREKRGYLECSVRAFVEKDASGHGVSCAVRKEMFSPSEAGEEAAETALRASKWPRTSPEEGRYDVVFGRLAMADLLGQVGMSLSAFNVDAGLSPLKGKLGERVAAEVVSMNDTGVHEDGIRSHAFDDEGYPTQATPAIQNGVLKTYLHNTSTAARYNVESTGNAGVISPHPWNIELVPGEHSEEELLEGVKNGLIVTNVWYTRYRNYATGDLSTIPRDGIFRVSRGEITGSLKGVRISDNLLNILGSIDAVSEHSMHVHWWEVPTPVFTPMVRARDITITKSTK